MTEDPAGGTPGNVANKPSMAALNGLRIIDVATLFAAPFAAMLLGDYGADVIKVEHPNGDPARAFGARHDGVPLWWKVGSRNKRCVTLSLSTREGQQIFRRLAATADVVVENFRPGTLERWGLDYPTLSAENPRLILVRVTAFGQSGPYARRPGFGTLAEAMSGLAAMTGEADGPPMLPSFPLGDAIAGLTAAVAVLTAVQAREKTGRGQVVDLAIVDALVSILGGHIATFDKIGVAPRRHGNRSANNAPRNVYRTRDGDWVAVSATATSVAERVIRLVGRSDLATQPWFENGSGRAAHADELDKAVGGWISGRSTAEVIDEFTKAQAAVAPVYEIPQMLADPQIEARGTVIDVPDSELGSLRMPNVAFGMSETPGVIRWAGPPLGRDSTEILSWLGLTSSEILRLREGKVI